MKLERLKIAWQTSRPIPHPDGDLVCYSPELQAAVELAEAVAWVEANHKVKVIRTTKWQATGIGCNWYVSHAGRMGCGKTLPEAVKNLLKKIGDAN